MKRAHNLKDKPADRPIIGNKIKKGQNNKTETERPALNNKRTMKLRLRVHGLIVHQTFFGK